MREEQIATQAFGSHVALTSEIHFDITLPDDRPTRRRYRRAMAGEVWTDHENDLIIADYFAMLQDDLAHRPYSKAEHNRQVQAATGRGRNAIEFKHQNISAILKDLGEPWIDGYKPAVNFQMTLVDAVHRWISAHPAWLVRALALAPVRQMSEPQPLWIGPPPTLRNTPPPGDLEKMLVIARMFDVAGRDARNRALGRAGEERVLQNERLILSQAGQGGLAKKVRWVSEEDGDGAGYDIHSFGADGADRLIEVKTTNGWERTPFHISRNELDVAKERREHWHLIRLWNFARDAKAFEIRPPLDVHVSLTATTFQASFH